MQPKRFMQKLRLNRQAGFSLSDLLISMLLSSILAVMMTSFLSTNVSARKNMGVRIEVQQGLRVLLSIISRELRQAGACLPETGQFIALDGADNGTIDQLTLRIGQADPTTLACVSTQTNAFAPAGATVLAVDNGTIFDDVHLAYITPDGASGGFYTVASTSATSITISEPLNGSHDPGSSIYAVDEREYAIDTINGRQVLSMTIDGSSPFPLIDGVEAFNVEYHLGPCVLTSCAAVTGLPSDGTEWRLVRIIGLTASVKSHKPDHDGNYVTETGNISVRTRNFL